VPHGVFERVGEFPLFDPQDGREMLLDREAGVEEGVGVLEDVGDAGSAQGKQSGLAGAQEVLAFEENLSTHLANGQSMKETAQTTEQQGLPARGLAEDGEGLPPLQGEAHGAQNLLGPVRQEGRVEAELQ
jgi:hypothetical protein